MKITKKIENLSWDLEQLKQGLCFNAWDCGIEEPKDKIRFYRKTINKIIHELNVISYQIKE